MDNQIGACDAKKFGESSDGCFCSVRVYPALESQRCFCPQRETSSGRANGIRFEIRNFECYRMSLLGDFRMQPAHNPGKANRRVFRIGND